MGTEINTKMATHTAKEFWGGNTMGACLQITASPPVLLKDTVIEQLQEEGFIQVTMEEAAQLIKTLSEFVKKEAVRRQALLRDQIRDLKDVEKTVFHEVVNLPSDYFSGPDIAVDFVSAFCPKVKTTLV